MFINEHCGYMAENPKEYAEEIEAFIWRNRMTQYWNVPVGRDC